MAKVSTVAVNHDEVKGDIGQWPASTSVEVKTDDGEWMQGKICGQEKGMIHVATAKFETDSMTFQMGYGSSVMVFAKENLSECLRLA